MSESNSKEAQWRVDSPYIYNRFVAQLQDFAKSGQVPNSASQDMKYCMELQRERLRDRNIEMEHIMTPRGHFAKGPGYTKGWSDAVYESRMDYRTCSNVKKYYRDGKLLHSHKMNALLYETITDVRYGADVAKELYTCPSCGAISTMENIADGCSSCGAHFKMTDIYPKVTNYYYVEDAGETPNELKVSLGKSVYISIAIFTLIFFVYFMIRGFDGGAFFALFTSLIAGGVFGFVVGYVIWTFSKLAQILGGAGKSVKLSAGTIGSEKNYVACMQQYSPEFSYEYFKDKVVSLLKMIVYSKDAGKLPNYAGVPLGNVFYDIVDMDYTGAVGLRNFDVINGYVQVVADVYVDVLRDCKTAFNKSERVFTVTLSKNITKPVNMYFSISQIACKSCGAGFDATKVSDCPYCGNRYDVSEDDWIVTCVTVR